MTTHLDHLGTAHGERPPAIPAPVARRAALAVVTHAADESEAKLLLAMLGLDGSVDLDAPAQVPTLGERAGARRGGQV